MTEDVVHIAGVTVPRGSRAGVEVPLARLPVGAELDLSVTIVRGKRPGPTMFVNAAVHGDELNGVEIIRRLLRTNALARLRGTILAVPVVNVFGFSGGSRYLPDRRDLNRSFPGSERGSLAARVAHVFMREIVSRADFGIDLHTGALHRANLPQVRCDFSDASSFALATAFRPPVILDSHARDGSLREAAVAAGVPTIVFEGGEALRFDEFAIRAGLRGVLSTLRSVDMLPPRATPQVRATPVRSQSSTWVRAPIGGVFRPFTMLGRSVHEGDRLGEIGDPMGGQVIAVESPADGLVIGALRLPLVSEGDALLHIARVDSSPEVAADLVAQQEAHVDVPDAPLPAPNPEGEENGHA